MTTLARFVRCCGWIGYIGAALFASGPVRAATESIVYSFQFGADGASPAAPLVAVGGTLYGTTSSGGQSSVCCGTVFSVTPAGSETVVYRFQGGADGADPNSRLLDYGGSLFGTTFKGGFGLTGRGTVFSITPAGDYSLVANLTKPVGFGPSGPLTKVGAQLFGVTSGTVYRVTRTGKARLVYTFDGASDGSYLSGALLNVGGTLYGSATAGLHDYGTVFAVTPAGQETVLHAFNGNDGESPNGGLVNIGGTLFGTTQYDGGVIFCGTVFTIAPDGTFTLLHTFNRKDGCGPTDGLTRVGNILYGTTSSGGAHGVGTVFSITKTGVEHVVYDFRNNGTDGIIPLASLLNVNGTLYGTTYAGGANGLGTVYKIVP